MNVQIENCVKSDNENLLLEMCDTSITEDLKEDIMKNISKYNAINCYKALHKIHLEQLDTDPHCVGTEYDTSFYEHAITCCVSVHPNPDLLKEIINSRYNIIKMYLEDWLDTCELTYYFILESNTDNYIDIRDDHEEKFNSCCRYIKSILKN